LTLGERIKFARKITGYDVKELCEMMGISINTYYGYESDRYEPSFFVVCYLANVFKIPLEYFAGYRELAEREKERIFKERWEREFGKI
jgi:transcriptional regulator with XRE-family HTH domain